MSASNCFKLELEAISSVSVAHKVNAERVVYYREKASNMYPVLFYSISWTLAEVHNTISKPLTMLFTKGRSLTDQCRALYTTEIKVGPHA